MTQVSYHTLSRPLILWIWDLISEYEYRRLGLEFMEQISESARASLKLNRNSTAVTNLYANVCEVCSAKPCLYFLALDIRECRGKEFLHFTVETQKSFFVFKSQAY